MPTVPSSTKCKHLGCKEQRSKHNSYCLAHGGRDKTPKASEERQEFNSMYQTPFWRSLRKAHLSKHPLCACCLNSGKVVQAQHLDHVFPWRYIGEQAFYNNIFQSLCASCHNDKTWYEQRGIIKHYGYTDHRLEDYARVVNPHK